MKINSREKTKRSAEDWPPPGIDWYYVEDNICIACADCRSILPHLPKVDLVLTDPPWGISWNTNYSRFLRGSRDKERIIDDNTPFDPSPFLHFNSVMLWGANNFINSLPPGSWLLWDKRNGDGTAFLSDGEIAWWNMGRGIYIKSISGQWHRSTAGGFHPTQKPVELMKWCIKKNNQYGTILDPFMGSGTTLVAAKQLGRKAIGIEIEERYCQIAVERLRQSVLPLNVQDEERQEQGNLI